MKQTVKNIAVCVICVLFFGTCAFFSLAMLIPGASEAAEGAEMPAFLSEDGRISDGFGADFENWFSRRFAFRSEMVNAFSSIREHIFHTGNDQVTVGRDGFLFFNETLADFDGSAPMTDEELSGAADALLALSRYAESHGAAFLFVCAPNKNTIYPEMMPGHIVKGTSPSNLDRLYGILDRTDVPYADLRPALLAEKENALLYHKRDTHWNGLGARIAFETVMNALSVTLPDDFSGEPVRSDTFQGDLDSLLYPTGEHYDDDTVYDMTGKYVYTSAFSTPMDMQITSRSAGTAGKLLIFRDSFANAMLADFASAYSDARFERAIPFRIDLLENEKTSADTVIVLIAERNLRNLIGSAERIPDP